MNYHFKPSHIVPAFLFVIAVLYGGSKPSVTNAPPDDVSSPTNQPAATDLPTNAVPPVLMASRPWLATPTPPPPEPTTNHQQPTNQIPNWTARGAYCDWERIDFCDGFRFPIGTNFIDGVTLLAYGEVRLKRGSAVSALVEDGSSASSTSGEDAASPLSGAPSTFIYSLPARISLEPGVSSLTHGLTPSNSYLFSWHNCCANRSATNRVDASIELFRSGACSVRFDNVETIYPAPVPPDVPGHGQDADWVRATFPDEADAILAQGYDNWLLNDYVGINVENGHALIRVTVDPSAFDQPPTTINQPPIYLVCGPYRVNVTQPGTYAFPLEVLMHCEVRTCPTPIPLTFDFDDGYRGDYGPSFDVVDLNHPAPRPLLMMATPSQIYDYFYDLFMTPRIVAIPNSVPLQYAVGTKFDLFCNALRTGDYTFSELGDTLIEILTQSKAEVRAAQHAELVEIRSNAYYESLFGWFEITGQYPTNEVGFITNRVDATIFSGDRWHTESLGNRRSSHHLTAVTQHDSTAAVTVHHTHAMAEGVSAYVAVYMASTETRANPAYDDTISWCVTANSGGELSGSATLFDQMDMLSSISSWEHELYGIRRDPLFLSGSYFTAPSDDVLRLSLSATAQNATDGLRETCVQIVVYPVDVNGNIIGLPPWVNQN